PEPVRLLRVPPTAVVSAKVNAVGASLKVKVTVPVACARLMKVLSIATATVGTTVSIVNGVELPSLASKVNSHTTKFPLLYCPPGPPPGSVGFLIASRNIPVIGDAESIDAEIVYVSVPTEFWLVFANNSPGESKENVVPLREDSLWIETRVCGLD